MKRKMIIKFGLGISVLGFLFLALVCVLPQYLPMGLVLSRSIHARNVRPKLLYETDHNELLNACRTLLAQNYEGQYDFGLFGDPMVKNFPKAIQKLKPSYVVFDSNFVMIEMMGGMSHYGIRGYPKDFKPPFEYFKYGDIQLVEGLWYYDDGYQEDPNYHQFIESLRPKGRKLGTDTVF